MEGGSNFRNINRPQISILQFPCFLLQNLEFVHLLFSGFSTKRCFTQPRPEWRLMGHKTLKQEWRSEQEVMRVKLFRSASSKASIEVTYKVPVSEGICRGNKLQCDVTSKRTSGLFVFPTCQMLILAFCLLFQEGHAGRILMYLPVATRYAFSICFCVQTRNLSNVLPEQDSQWFRFYLTKMR